LASHRSIEGPSGVSGNFVSDKRLTGREGEDRAAGALKKQGYKIVSKNYRSPFGEIDIIAEDKDCLVFIEVKGRKECNFGTSLEAIDSKKKFTSYALRRSIARRIVASIEGSGLTLSE